MRKLIYYFIQKKHQYSDGHDEGCCNVAILIFISFMLIAGSLFAQTQPPAMDSSLHKGHMQTKVTSLPAITDIALIHKAIDSLKNNISILNSSFGITGTVTASITDIALLHKAIDSLKTNITIVNATFSDIILLHKAIDSLKSNISISNSTFSDIILLHKAIDSLKANITIANTTFAATQSGTWNINNISGTITLPSGASTAAKQPALGTAGTASADVITVQGIASMTALKTDGSATTQPISATSLPLPALAATSTKQSDGSAKSMIVDGSGNVISATSNTLDINAKYINGVNAQRVIDSLKFAIQAMHKAADSLKTNIVLATGSNTIGAISNTGFNVNNTPAVSQSGTWNIGTITTLPRVGILKSQDTVDVRNFPATYAATQSGNWSTRTQDGSGNTIGSTSSSLDINTKYIGGVAAQRLLDSIKFAIQALHKADDSIKANQTNATQKTQMVDGSGNVVGSTSNGLDINVKKINNTTPTFGWGLQANGLLVAIPKDNIVKTVNEAYASGSQSCASGCGSTTLIPLGGTSIAVDSFQSWSLHITSIGGGGTVQVQLGNDGTNFPGTAQAWNNATNPNTTMNAVGFYSGTLGSARYVRVQFSAYTSGTFTAYLVLKSYPFVPSTLMVSGGGNTSVTISGTVTANPTPITTGQNNDFHLISAATTNASVVKASTGALYGYTITNTNAAFRYVKLYNKTSAPTVGTDVPVYTIGIPPNATVTKSGGFGVNFGTGISLSTNTGIADNDNNAVGANDLAIEIETK